MSWFHKPRFSMPLLAKDLAELANRIRTYRIRAAFALLFYVPAMSVVLFNSGKLDLFGNKSTAQAVFGPQMMTMVFAELFISIYLFLPAMMAPAIASERENGSLPLLFLTDMSPMEILLQKYVGRILPFMSLILLALPLFAVAYAFGGLRTTAIAVNGFGLVLVTLQVGAIALFASARCSTTAGSIVLSYIVGAAVLFSPDILARCLEDRAPAARWSAAPGPDPSLDFWFALADVLRMCFSPYHALNALPSGASFLSVVRSGVPAVLSILLFLLFARISLPRCSAEPRRSWTTLFRRLDSLFSSWNRHFGNTTVLTDRTALPDNHPVAWREMHKGGLGQRHHLLRSLLACTVPLAVLLLILLVLGEPAFFGPVAGLAWLVCGTLLVTQAASSLPAERSRQTLEVLLATPVDASEIVHDKVASLRRLATVLAVPLLSLYVLPASGLVGNFMNFSQTAYSFTLYLVGTIVGLRYLLWIGFSCGLFLKSRAIAVASAIALSLVVFVGLPMLVLRWLPWITGSYALSPGNPVTTALLAMPSLLVVASLTANEWAGFTWSLGIGPILAWFVTALLLLSGIRMWCLAHASEILRDER